MFGRVRRGGSTLAVGISKGFQRDLSSHAGGDAGDPLLELERHVARELHDQVAQPLISLVLDIGELRLRSEGAAAADLARLEDAAREVLRQTREMLIDLRGDGELRVNFVEVLKSELPGGDGYRPSLQVSSRWPRRINGWAAFNLLRIVQQAVGNAQRHGRAEKVDVFLDIGPAQEAVLVVLDDGIGIDGAQRGYGMVGMQERAEILGGTFAAQPRDAGGTRIEVRIPLRRLR